MPKLFPIHIEVEEMYVGRVYRMLDNMDGVAKIVLTGLSEKTKPNGHAEARKGTPRGPYKKYETTGDEALFKVMHGKPPMTVSQMADSFEAMGRSPVSVHSLVHKLKKSGDLVAREDGSYALAQKVRDKLRHRKAAKKKK
jgi:hypothetical protein